MPPKGRPYLLLLLLLFLFLFLFLAATIGPQRMELNQTLRLKIVGKKLLIFEWFSTISQFNRKCVWNKIRYRQSANGLANYRGSPIFSQNFTNFGPKNRTCIFTDRYSTICYIYGAISIWHWHTKQLSMKVS